ncbi:MAG: peptidoglycan DD-metalloendopeptidase family protein [Methylococcales bacterium]
MNAKGIKSRLWINGILLVLASVIASCASNLPPIRSSKDLKDVKTYTVQKGDTLFSISWRGELDYKTLGQWNNIRPPYTIYVGQKLRLFKQQLARKYSIVPTQTKHRYQKPRSQEPVNKIPKTIKAARSTAWIWPITGAISKSFLQTGSRGIEVVSKRGHPVVASASGKVVYSGNGLIGYGNLIIIKHDDTYLSAYGFNKQLFANEGQWVKKGQKIAEVGSIAGNKPALHFEIRKNGKPVDPMRFLSK